MLESLGTFDSRLSTETQSIYLKIEQKMILYEIGYLRATLAPDIRQMCRQKVDGKIKTITFTVNELKQSMNTKCG